MYRLWCRHCRVSFTLLPLDVLAHWQYPREFIIAWLWAALRGTSCRSREFLITEGVPIPERDPATSWTDQQDAACIRPSHQLLARWTREFSARAARLIPTLTSLCVYLGLELKQVAAHVGELAAPGQGSLPVALGLLHVLHDSVVPDVHLDLRDLLTELVAYLGRRQLPSSHGILRASGGRLLYDSLIT